MWKATRCRAACSSATIDVYKRQVVNARGYYIVSASPATDLAGRDNFYDTLEAGRIDDGVTVEEMCIRDSHTAATARTKLQAQSAWTTLEFVLNGIIFVVLGLSLIHI